MAPFTGHSQRHRESQTLPTRSHSTKQDCHGLSSPQGPAPHGPAPQGPVPQSWVSFYPMEPIAQCAARGMGVTAGALQYSSPHCPGPSTMHCISFHPRRGAELGARTLLFQKRKLEHRGRVRRHSTWKICFFLSYFSQNPTPSIPLNCPVSVSGTQSACWKTPPPNGSGMEEHNSLLCSQEV